MSLFATDRVLVPIDFSETSFEALAKTIEFVKDASHIYVIHVLPPLNPGEPGVMWRTVDSQTRKSHVEKVLSDRFKERDILPTLLSTGQRGLLTNTS
uniref:UspA domain-containing protein n=1 Tax=Moorena producens (strain JHB) TaxID=1454205 RepID=A0A1D9FVU7_MOOP1